MSDSARGIVAIVGQGYVGLPLAMAAASSGWKILGIDHSEERVLSLNSGKSHIEDVKDNQLQEAIKSGRYIASGDFEQISSADICILCVPTPVDSAGKPDTSYLERAVISVAPHLKRGALLINESTSYPGTVRELIIPLVEKHRGEGVESLLFSSSPERVDPGNTLWSLKSTPRLVSGIDEESKASVVNFYRSFCDEVILVSSPEVAEMAKLLENTFRQVNIALVNQLLPLSQKLGIDLREVIEAAGSKPYGYMKFFPGAGVGGHCIPVDPLYLLWKARDLGVDLPFVANADQVNSAMPKYVVQRLIDLAKPESGSLIAVLGVSYKPGVSDTRESPAEDVMNELISKGFKPLWSDPLVESFHDFEQYKGQRVSGAILVTNQAGLPISDLIDSGVKMLDCTGTLKGISLVEQL
jgi:UDP-N-acetyl-D-glucosamine dehydrogenase